MKPKPEPWESDGCWSEWRGDMIGDSLGPIDIYHCPSGHDVSIAIETDAFDRIRRLPVTEWERDYLVDLLGRVLSAPMLRDQTPIDEARAFLDSLDK